MFKTYSEFITVQDDINSNSKSEVADIFRQYGIDYIKSHPLPAHYLKVIHDISVCRTPYLGGHIYKCNHCGFESPVYNSCRNRHCPKCQFTARLKWVEKRKSELLPVGYFHNVFTLPHELNPLVLRNKNVCLNLLFKSVSETLLQFGINNAKGKIGFIAILHSWTQTLLDHFHLHCLIPAVAFSGHKDHIIRIRQDYLFNVENLSKVFMGKYIDYLINACHSDKLIFPGRINRKDFYHLIDSLWKKEWVVYSKKPFSDPETVLEYLSRYTHRVAIANQRIVSIMDAEITFKYKDRNNDNLEKQMTLTADEFMRRFLLHILPENFMKIRYYGFLGNRDRKDNIRLCLDLLEVDYVQYKEKNISVLMEEVTGINITMCPQCKKGQLNAISKILSFREKTIKNNSS
jgi:hypothetical protein